MKNLIALLVLIGLVAVVAISAVAVPPGGSTLSPGQLRDASRQPSPDAGTQRLIARYTNTAPVINGKMAPREWSAAVPFPVNFMTPDRTPGILPFGTEQYTVPDPNDLSYTLYAMYDSEYLYVAVDVADDILCGDSGMDVPFDDDVELFFDGDRSNICPTGEWAWVCEAVPGLCDRCDPSAMGLNDFTNWNLGEPIVMGEEGFQLLTSYAGVGWANSRDPIAWESKVGPRPRGYVVEYRIALQSIDTEDGAGDTPPGPGTVIGFTAVVGDDDISMAYDEGGQWLPVGTCGSGYEDPDDNYGVWDGWAGWFLEDFWGTLYFEPAKSTRAKPGTAGVESSSWGQVKEEAR